MAPAPRLVLENVQKVFAGQVALAGVDLTLEAGRIHGLVGQNGSGKSTLIKVLAGYHSPEDGAVARLDGEPFPLGSAAAAERSGIRFIHQDLGLVPSLNTVDNLALGHGYGSRRWIGLRAEARRARELLREFGFELDVEQPLAALGPGQLSGVAIARAFRADRDGLPLRVLVLDEPTESLGRPEVERLFRALRQVARSGTAILYVSHRLEEVLEITDEVTVLRDGRVVGRATTADLDQPALVRLIIGGSAPALSGESSSDVSGTRLRVDGLTAGAVRAVSFGVAAGEIVGVAGITGSGREQLAALIGCAVAREGGEVLVDGNPVRSASPRAALRSGLVFVAADRQRESAIPSMPVDENLTLPKLETRGPTRWLGRRTERREAARWLELFEVVPRDPSGPLASLSGGNQQKVVLARAMRCRPSVLVVDEPVQGVDIGAKAAIYQLLLDAARDGVAVVLVSSDVEEFAPVCDRVLVMRGGTVKATLTKAEATRGRIAEECLLGAEPQLEVNR